ncbi:hypothetical protein [Caldisalinibacter kiritimatiensis]|uniref:HTH araC/xylS-type domain-containing protein n=1 Tax=Caldisalinibacter kiritimatiensis TaxID=1304284 RepID=R1CU78_9FIRM|nr:hypothetical protein [Caldisalinibacter kiritimatiensis]EOD00234.1 hypothetical protein L21TH_1708 [Caldisalinibacter kiritimatiensis]
MINKCKIGGIVLIIILVLIGCSKTEIIEENTVRVSDSDLFEGELKKLEPHMGLITGSAKIEYNGDKDFIGCKYEIWENGEITETSDIFSTRIDGEFDGEINISLKQLINNELEKSDNMIMTTSLGNENGYSSSTKYIKRFDENYGYSPYELTEEIIVTDDSDISVWGLMASDDSVFSQEKTIEETAEKVDWAIVVKVYFKN